MFWKSHRSETPNPVTAPVPPAAPAPAAATVPLTSKRLEVDLDKPEDVTRALRVLGKIVGRKGGRPRKARQGPAEAAAAAATAPPPPPAQAPA